MPTAKKKTDNQRVAMLKRVFAAAKEQGIRAEDLREFVPSWGFPRLSRCDKWDLQQVLKYLGRWYIATDNRHNPTQDQLDYIQNLWATKSDQRDKHSCDTYIRKKFGIESIVYTTIDQASKVIQSLRRWD